MITPQDYAFFQTNFFQLIQLDNPITLLVLVVLLGFSLFSLAIIFSKWGALRRAQEANRKFLRAFRKSTRLDAVAAATEQFGGAPLVTVFDFGYSEVCRQVAARSKVTNLVALERSLQLGISDELSRLEHNMSWLATIAAVCPFIGLFGTVMGILDAFEQLGLSNATNMRAVGPSIADALLATGLGLFAAIPAYIAYNYFSNSIRVIGQRMDDFALEFLNLTERNFEGQ